MRGIAPIGVGAGEALHEVERSEPRAVIVRGPDLKDRKRLNLKLSTHASEAGAQLRRHADAHVVLRKKHVPRTIEAFGERNVAEEEEPEGVVSGGDVRV